MFPFVVIIIGFQNYTGGVGQSDQWYLSASHKINLTYI